jgi:hypothetical protein
MATVVGCIEKLVTAESPINKVYWCRLFARAQGK